MDSLAMNSNISLLERTSGGEKNVPLVKTEPFVQKQENYPDSKDGFFSARPRTMKSLSVTPVNEWALLAKIHSLSFNAKLFYPYYDLDETGYKMPMAQEQSIYKVKTDMKRFFTDPLKPFIVVIADPENENTLEQIVFAYGRDQELSNAANLAIFTGIERHNHTKNRNEYIARKNILLLLDTYDLYGKMAITRTTFSLRDLPEIYRLAARQKGVFIDTTEKKDLASTIYEPAACGLPVVSRHIFKEKEIIERQGFGLFVNIENALETAGALKQIITETKRWEQFSENAIATANVCISPMSGLKKRTLLSI